jgi:hypothetical protein
LDENRQGKAFLDRIVAMLTKMGGRGYVIREELLNYEQPSESESGSGSGSVVHGDNPENPNSDSDSDPDSEHGLFLLV